MERGNWRGFKLARAKIRGWWCVNFVYKEGKGKAGREVGNACFERERERERIF